MRQNCNWVAHGWSFLAGAQCGMGQRIGRNGPCESRGSKGSPHPNTTRQTVAIWWYSTPKGSLQIRRTQLFHANTGNPCLSGGLKDL